MFKETKKICTILHQGKTISAIHENQQQRIRKRRGFAFERVLFCKTAKS